MTPIRSTGRLVRVVILKEYSIENHSRLLRFTANNGQREVEATALTLDAPDLKDRLGEELYQTLQDDVELIEGAGADFDQSRIDSGKLTPVFFGSALTNFGVEPFLEEFPSDDNNTRSRVRKADTGIIDPFSEDFFGICI